MRLAKLGRDLRALYGMQLAAIGRGTADALAGYGLTADLIPAQYDGSTSRTRSRRSCRRAAQRCCCAPQQAGMSCPKS